MQTPSPLETDICCTSLKTEGTNFQNSYSIEFSLSIYKDKPISNQTKVCTAIYPIFSCCCRKSTEWLKHKTLQESLPSGFLNTEVLESSWILFDGIVFVVFLSCSFSTALHKRLFSVFMFAIDVSYIHFLVPLFPRKPCSPVSASYCSFFYKFGVENTWTCD